VSGVGVQVSENRRQKTEGGGQKLEPGNTQRL
jgi:hypothetical protein